MAQSCFGKKPTKILKAALGHVLHSSQLASSQLACFATSTLLRNSYKLYPDATLGLIY